MQKITDQPALIPDLPWEREIYTFGSLLRDGGTYRCWYQVLNRGHSDRCVETAVGYAESNDLISWRKPFVGREIPGLGRSNLLVLSSGRTDLCSPSVLRVSDPVYPYRMAYFDAIRDIALAKEVGTLNRAVEGWRPIEGEGIFIAKSRDGFHWEHPLLPVIYGPNDVLALALLPNGQLLLTFKTSQSDNRHYRIIAASVSADLGETWADPCIILRPDVDDPAGTEFYGLTPFIRYGYLYGLLQVYHNTPDNKRMEIQLVHSQSQDEPLKPWRRAVNRSTILELGGRGAWDASRVYPGSPFVSADGELMMPYGGANTNHDDRRYIRRAIGFARSVGSSFAKMRADPRGGSLTLATPLGEVAIKVDTTRTLSFKRSKEDPRQYSMDGRVITNSEQHPIDLPADGLGNIAFGAIKIGDRNTLRII